mmetsp:Transcript_12954/g.27367  ORF Transcript_12954/g.27367 Transcript_12954/m.27367 type:complete len:404 (+) Transcript_12954:23-1234(+)
MEKPSSSSTAAFTLPQFMRAAQITDYGTDLDKLLSIQNNVPTPRLGEDTPPAKFDDPMLLRVLSVALAPGDARVLSGMTRELQGPPSFPYTPGGDVCGIVVAMPDEGEKDKKKKSGKEKKYSFGVGDRVAARFVNKPMGMLGEYALVSPAVCDRVPDNVSSDDAAALVSSGTVAVILADSIQEGDRVLIYGAGGGVGSHLCQAVRLKGASYVAGVGMDAVRLKEKPICCDEAINYEKVSPLDVKEWQDEPFDVMIDLAGGMWPTLREHIKRTKKPVVKPASKGGRFLTVNADQPTFEAHSVWAILKIFLFPALWRAFYTRYSLSRFSMPKYTYAIALPGTSDIATRTFSLAAEKKIVTCLDKRGPFPFTDDGVRDAFRLQRSRHAKGKVVIRVAEEDVGKRSQ